MALWCVPDRRCRRVVAVSLGAIAVSGLAAGADASVVVLLDFNNINGSGGPNGTWNSYAAPGNVNGGILKDSGGANTPYTATLAAGASDSSNAGTDVVFHNTIPDSLPAWATSGDNNDASGDYFFTNNAAGVHTLTLTFGGFTPGDRVSVDLLASRNEANQPGGLYEYSLNGSTYAGFSVLNSDGTPAMTDGWDTFNTQTKAYNNETQGYNLHRYMNVSDVTLTGPTLTVRVTDSSLNDTSINASYAVLNAVRLTVVPEPSAAAAFAIGAGLLALRRRRA